MHSSFDTVAEGDTLLSQTVGMNQIGLRFARSQKPKPTDSEFFASVAEARSKITEVLLDMTVDGCWISCQTPHEVELHTLLVELNEQRPYSPVSTSRQGAMVYDLL